MPSAPVFFDMLQISIFCKVLFLISQVEQQVETAEITIVDDIRNLLLVKEHNLMYGFGERLE
jgi:hypothetical protein